MGRFLSTLLIPWLLLAGWCNGGVIFTLGDLTRQAIQITPGDGVVGHTIDLDNQQRHLRILVQGAAGAKCRVTIPLARPIQAAGELRFNGRTLNLMSPPGEPALFLKLADEQLLPVLRPQGGDYAEVGRVAFGHETKASSILGFGMVLKLDETGQGEINLTQLEISIEPNLLAEAEVKALLRSPPAVEASLKALPNCPLRPFVNDQILAGIGYSSADWQRPLGTEHVAWQRVRLNLGGRMPGDDSPLLLPYEDYLDVQALRQALDLAQKGPGWLIVELRLASPPQWWQGKPFHLDEKWQAYCRQMVEQVLAQLARWEHRDRIVAITLAVGDEGAGRPWPLARSLQTENAFRLWLDKRYTTPLAVRDAWKEPMLNLEQSLWLPPDPAGAGDIFDFYHPVAGRRSRDAYAFVEETWMTFVLDLVHTIKEGTGRRLLVGLYGGPSGWANPGAGLQARWSRQALMALLECPDLDLLEVPAELPQPLLLADAAASHQKLLLVRYRPWQAGSSSSLRRMVATTALQPALLEIQATRVESYQDEALQAELKRIQEATERVAILDRVQPVDVAFGMGSAVYDSLAPTANDAALLAWPRESWSRAGFPYRTDFVDDLSPEEVKMVVYFQALQAEAGWMKRAEAARAAGRVEAFTWATAVVSADRVSPQTLADVAQLGIRWRPGASRFFLSPRPAMRSDMGIDQIVGYVGWPSAAEFQDIGAGFRQGPIFLIDDPKATVMADFADDGEPAMAWKKHDNWTSFYSASPYLNPEILRALASEAKVHTYLSANDPCVISGRFIAVFPVTDGIRDLTMPHKETLFAVWHQQELEAATIHRLEMKAGASYLFFRGSWDEWINARR